MDEKFLENAEDLTRTMVEKAIELCRNDKNPPPNNFTGECSCGEYIPKARVALGYYRCVECQSFLERKTRAQI